MQFLNLLKVNYARMLLSTTELSILETALTSGFDSLSNFARVFKETTGLSPALYRKRNKNT